MSEGFFTDLDTAILLYRFCQRYRINTEKERITVMREITRRKKAKYIRDVKEFIQDKNAFIVKNKENK